MDNPEVRAGNLECGSLLLPLRLQRHFSLNRARTRHRLSKYLIEPDARSHLHLLPFRQIAVQLPGDFLRRALDHLRA